MRITVLMCHFKTEKMTKYSVYQFLLLKGRHDVDIFICNNNVGDGSLDWAKGKENVRVFDYPKDKLQSHGIGYDFMMPFVETEHFLTAESDSFPTQDNWLDYYENLIHKGFDSAASLLKLSGGTYGHPAGALYRKSVYDECKAYCDSMPYAHFPHIAMKDGFPCHLMVRDEIVERFCDNPTEFIEVSKKIKDPSSDGLTQLAFDYSPVKGVFHNGMGGLQESYLSYGERNPLTGVMDQHKMPEYNLIYRLGYEPGQFLHYWQLARGKKVFHIPTHTIWMKGRENQQQDSTIMENGFRHLWAVSSYFESNDPDRMDIINRKREMVDKLYNSLPENEKIP